MQKSIFRRYFTMCIAISLVSIVFLGSFFMGFITQYFRTEKEQLLISNVQRAAQLTVKNLEDNGGNLIDYNLLLSGYTIFAGAVDAQFFLVNTNGDVILCTESPVPNRPTCQHSKGAIDQEILNKAYENGQFFELGTLKGIYQNKNYTAGIPVKTKQGYAGVVFATASASALSSLLMDMFSLFLVSASVVLVLSFILVYYMTSRMVRPLKEMATATRNFSKGDFSQRIYVRENDEVGQLAIAFNNMAKSLSNLENMRRNFISNVSHELRTPMTTIGGFIDGILDGTIPEDQRDKYLQIVSQEVKRLTRMVKSMLSITRMEAGEMKMNTTVFDVCEVIRQAVFTFETRIEEKRIQLIGLETENIFVEADSDLIHQVVYNLVENAVKFTPQDGQLEFHFHTESHLTYIGVKNSGQGIPKEELPRIFDKFYKSDRSRSMDKSGVGLGLYIVRSIINMHGGEIIARSEPGQYSEFVFSLRTAKKSGKLAKKGGTSEKIK